MSFESDLLVWLPHLRRYARALTRDPAWADDLVQDTLERALSKWRWGRGGNLFYDTNPRETALLGYRRGDIARAVENEMVPDFKQRMGL